MKYFHGQDQSNCSSKQVNDRFVTEAAPLSPSGTARYSELHTTELPIEFHEEEIRIRYAESGSTGKQGRSIYERGLHLCWLKFSLLINCFNGYQYIVTRKLRQLRVWII